jgi:hypothetical protein
MFDLEGHFRAWWNHHNRQYDIIFVRYESLQDLDVRRRVAEFMDSPLILRYNMTKRMSDWRALSVERKDALERLLGGFRDWQATLPDVVYLYRKQ